MGQRMKVTTYDNPRLTVYFEELKWLLGPSPGTFEAMRWTLSDARKRIVQHINGFTAIEEDYDKTETCSFCGRTWGVDEETGEPLCCDAAVDEWKAEQEARDEKPE